MEEVEICSLSEYMNYIEMLPHEFTLSRGQWKNYPLLPGAFRKTPKGILEYSRQTVSYFLEEFKISSQEYFSDLYHNENKFEIMFNAQHYGLPTKLLDFTFSHILSLLFAVEKSFIEEEDEPSVVYFLNPSELNQKFSSHNKIINIIQENSIQLEDMDGPVAIRGSKINKRISAQNGVFVYFQDGTESLENILDNEPSILGKIVINEEHKKGILSNLFSMGINFSSIYPEIDSISKNIITQKFISDFQKDVEND